jgi:glycosyl transferase family 2
MDLSALRLAGLIAGVGVIAFAVWRRRSLRNVDVLIILFAGLGLILVSATNVADTVLEFFDFRKGGGNRILGLAVFAIFILFLLTLRSLWQIGRVDREVSAVLEGIAWEEFRSSDMPERFKDRIAVVIPAYNEQDWSRDGTDDVARAHGAAVARHVINRGGGAALRTGYRLTADSGATVVVTLDADGQHLPEEMSRLVKPILDGEVDVAHGSRVLGHAEPNHFARELGIVFFNRLISLITRTKVSDCSNGYRAVRTTVLPQLVLRQEQFHTSEFMIEAIKRGIPAREVPVTVARRLHGHSKKPAVFRYGLGFANAIVRAWLR